MYKIPHQHPQSFLDYSVSSQVTITSIIYSYLQCPLNVCTKILIIGYVHVTLLHCVFSCYIVCSLNPNGLVSLYLVGIEVSENCPRDERNSSRDQRLTSEHRG